MVQKIFLVYPENMAYLRKKTSRVRLTQRGLWGVWAYALVFEIVWILTLIIWAPEAFLWICGGVVAFIVTLAWSMRKIIRLRLFKKYGLVIKGKVTWAGEFTDFDGDHYLRIDYEFRVPGTQDVIRGVAKPTNKTSRLPPETGTSVAVFYASEKYYQLL